VISLTPAFRLYAQRRRRRIEALDPVEAQERELLKLVRRAQDTRFGSDHGFESIRSVSDFQKAAPLRRYENLWKEYWEPHFPELVDVTWPGKIPFFAVTSGTTLSASKNIPVTHEMNRANSRGALDLLCHHLVNRPESRAIDGKNFFLGGSVALQERAPSVFSGDLSGIAVRQTPRWYRPFTFPPANIKAEPDWEKRIERIVEIASQADIRILGGTPSWLLYFIEKLHARNGGAFDARKLFPNLELLVHGGVNFKPYRARFEAFLSEKTETREVYPASEGFIASQDARPEDGLRLMVDNGLFFEFVPVDELESENPSRHTLADVEPGVNYAIVLSSCAGCWAYILGDTVRFVTRDPPRLLVTGRISYFMSAFGEHLIGEEIEAAVADGASAIGMAISDFSMGAVFPHAKGECGHHLYVVEFADGAPDEAKAEAFSAAIDKGLCARNDDYRAERLSLGVIAPPKTLVATHGTFADWMKARGRFGGQNKVPRVINDSELFSGLENFTRERIKAGRE
jgi:hypothetical protein